MNSKNAPCFSFQRGFCKFGARCKYSHDPKKTQNGAKRESGPRKPIALNGGSDQEFMEWRHMVPKPGSAVFPLRERLDDFFQQASCLVCRDPGIMQEVIKQLATENGLQRIHELTRQDFDGVPARRRSTIFSSQVLPLFQLMSHSDVLSSAILEQEVGTLYACLYGPNGQRGIKIFSFSSKMLDPEEASVSDIEVCVTVLSRMIDANGTAAVNEQLLPCAKSLVNLTEDRASHDARMSLHHADRINRRLDLGLKMKIKSSSMATTMKAGKAEFMIHQAPPGGRHNNDSADICSIRIMPTFSEIRSDQAEYLPVNKPEHLHLPSLQGLLDRQFRLLREDNIGPLRDAIRAEWKSLRNPDTAPGAAEKRTKGSQRKYSYYNARVMDLGFEKRRGFQFSVQFDKPEHLSKVDHACQGEWWEQTRRLQLDSLVCLLNLEESVVFCTVCEPPSDPEHEEDGILKEHERNAKSTGTVYELPSEKGKAYVNLTPVNIDDTNAQRLLECFLSSKRIGRTSLVLVEFPGVLLPSFRPTLLALRQMQKTADLPFADFLAPNTTSGGAMVTVPPPRYTLGPGFRFNLGCVMKNGEDLFLNTREPFDVKKLQEGSSLDNAQAVALVNSLSRGLALIQGPPGTGKSYTGVALIRVLLANKRNEIESAVMELLESRPRASAGAAIGPILCVCYTNHALDQLLEHLVGAGVDQVIRIGSRSKSELLSECNLRKVSQKSSKTKAEGGRLYDLHNELKNLEDELENLLNELKHAHSQATIREYLQARFPAHHAELFGLEDEDGFTEVRHDKKSALGDWLRGGCRDSPGKTIQRRRLGVLLVAPLKGMSHSERQMLHQFWLSEITRPLFEKIKRSLEDSEEKRARRDRIRREVDLRCLNQANVIGVTTTGLARNIDLLRRVKAKVMLCEEAGEVLESHTITAFLPSVQHVILIGDHLQLRPQIKNYNLQHDSPNGEQYSLDLSLFERLVQPPKNDGLRLPFTTLETQRRMDPSISGLIRKTLYPTLQDSPCVSDYPQVKGFRKRLFWFDHEMPETEESETATTSRTNDFEVEMTASVVTHLVRQGSYSSQDIAVLTPYLGQLQKLKRRFASSFEIVLNERDQDDLGNAGLENTSEQETAGELHKQVAKTTLRDALRVATVDNFQGEEAAVVVISLVRCNAQSRCGFLKTSNRINVLLSRAKHGMYIIGNARTSRHVGMWNEVISMLKNSDNFGSSLELMCPRHPDTTIAVSKPDDFSQFAPEGGCSLKCDKRLQCGHACMNKCHSDVLHAAVKCLEKCPRSLDGCDHACPRVCGDPCVELCKKPVYDPSRILPCGHNEPNLPCWKSQDLAKAICKRMVTKSVPECEHEISVPCATDVSADSFRCTALCGALLPCGHNCKRACHECQAWGGHGKCSQPCGRNYTTCQHSCSKECHGDEHCPPCGQPCVVSCSHSRCPKKCNEPCVPCAEGLCASSCPHSRCTMPCAVPCNHLPCSKRCQQYMACGHQCPSLCGEICPGSEFCQTCAQDEIKDLSVDYIEGLTYKEIDLDEDPCIFPRCGHPITMSNLDGHMSLGDHYEFSPDGSITDVKSSNEPFSSQEVKSCPNCRGSLRSVARYGRIVRRALLDESTKKFIVWSNSQYIRLAELLLQNQKKLEETTDDEDRPTNRLPPSNNTSLNGSRHEQLIVIRTSEHGKRYSAIDKLRKKIFQYAKRVSTAEQPFQRVADMVKNIRRENSNAEPFNFGSEVLQTRGHILAVSLLLQCDLTIMSDFISLALKSPNGGSVAGQLSVDFSQNRKDCEELISMAQASQYPKQVVEGHVFFANYASLECSLSGPDGFVSLREEAIEHLNAARRICDENDSTARALGKIEAAERDLRESTFYSAVTSTEMQDVLAAMRSEFRGTGHWYYCENNHPFTIGECGMPMEEASCPQCGARVGGANHRLVAGAHRATDLESGMEGLTL